LVRFFLDSSAFENETDRLSPRVSKKINFALRKIAKECKSNLLRDESMMTCNHVWFFFFFVMKTSVLGEVKSQAKEIVDHIS
jgi:hypothetical protein